MGWSQPWSERSAKGFNNGGITHAGQGGSRGDSRVFCCSNTRGSTTSTSKSRQECGGCRTRRWRCPAGIRSRCRAGRRPPHPPHHSQGRRASNEGREANPHRPAPQLLNRSDALARHHLIASHRFIKHQRHNGAALRHAGADIHRLNGGHLGDGQITADIGVHDRLGIGELHGVQRHRLGAGQPSLFSQIEVFVARPVGHRHPNRFRGAAQTGCNRPETAKSEGRKCSAGGLPIAAIAQNPRQSAG